MVVNDDGDSNVQLLKVGSASDPKAVAQAIYRCIFDGHNWPVLRAIGHGAVGQAAKSVAIARGLVAASGLDLATIIGFETIEGDGGKEISAIVFRMIQR